MNKDYVSVDMTDNPKIKLTDEDVQIIKVEKTPEELKMFPNTDFYHVRFLSLEGNEIWWGKSDAEQLKQQILDG